MQVWESDASEHLAFGSDAGAKECEPDGHGQGQAAAGKRERGCRAEKRRGGRGDALEGCLIEGMRDGTMHRGVC